MKMQGSIALVTGANRGLGAAFAAGLLSAGAAKVYAAARNPESIALPGVVRVKLDVTQPDQIAALAREVKDVTLLVNNAGIGEFGPMLAAGAVESLQRQLDINAVGPLRMVQAFAPTLIANRGGAIVNVLSGLSWLSLAGRSGAYSASKSAGWAISNALRQELQTQGVELLAVHCAFIDTEMARAVPGPKLSPAEVVRQTLAALEAGEPELLADALTQKIHAGFVAQPRAYVAGVA
jgi:NAD(P)-dependent dehydrogenase (short-subunit alcohol dehydrogenase family)